MPARLLNEILPHGKNRCRLQLMFFVWLLLFHIYGRYITTASCCFLRMQPVSDSIIYEVLFQNPVQSPMTVSFSVDYRFWLCNTHAVVWIRPHGKPLILTPETASTEVSWVLGGWSLFALCACRSRILPTPFHLISGFLSFHQTCWYLSFLLKSQPVYFHLHY